MQIEKQENGEYYISVEGRGVAYVLVPQSDGTLRFCHYFDRGQSLSRKDLEKIDDLMYDHEVENSDDTHASPFN